MLVLDQELANSLWKRLQKGLNDNDLALIKPIGFGNEGTW